MQQIKSWSQILLISLIMFIAGAAWASGSASENPTTPPAGVNLVNAGQVEALMANGAILLDTRKGSEFAEGSIKGAISVVYDEKSAKEVNYDASKDSFDLSKIANKDADYVVFCNGPTCWRSYKTVVMMAKNGYKKIHWYRDGFPDWQARNLPIE